MWGAAGGVVSCLSHFWRLNRNSATAVAVRYALCNGYPVRSSSWPLTFQFQDLKRSAFRTPNLPAPYALVVILAWSGKKRRFSQGMVRAGLQAACNEIVLLRGPWASPFWWFKKWFSIHKKVNYGLKPKTLKAFWKAMFWKHVCEEEEEEERKKEECNV